MYDHCESCANNYERLLSDSRREVIELEKENQELKQFREKTLNFYYKIINNPYEWDDVMNAMESLAEDIENMKESEKGGETQQ